MIRRAYNWAFTHFISRSNPEDAHHWGLGAISLAGRFAPTRGLMRATLGYLDPTHSPTRVVGGVEVPLTLGERRLPSRLGLAAGMDKDAEAVLGMCALGYAFVEIGTVTPRPQPGNDAPRLWRLMEERGLRNRMGFNNAGADAAAEKLRELRSTPAGRAAIVGANIGKNKVTSEADAPADYEYCAKTLAHWVDFVVVNVSSPNTPGLRDLQSVDHLRPILQAARRGCEAGAPDRIMPLFVKQIRASRGMQLLQPEMQALQAKYKGKKDPESRQRMNEEMMALYRKHGTNPMASCLPILVQMPIFFALFRVLASLGAVAGGSYGRPSIGPLTQELAKQVQASSVFGASLSSSFMSSTDTQVKIVTVAMIVIMSVTQWYTMAQLSMKNMSTESLNSDNPMIRSQRMMLYVMPVIFAVSGVNFQIGVLVYWVVSNLWTMGQQFFTIRNMPAPGSEAEKKYRARINAKRARKGLPSLEEEERAEAIAKAEAEGRTGGQRVQPVRKNRQKKSGGQGESRSEAFAQDSDVEQLKDADEDKGSTSSKSGGLSDEEIARRRYERRARQRREAAARRKAQAKKKHNR